MKSDRKRGNSVVTAILALIFLIVGIAGGAYVSRSMDLGFLDGFGGGAAPAQGAARPIAAAAQSEPQATPEPVAEANTVVGDGALTAQDGEDVLTPAAVTIIQLPVKVGDEVNRGDVLARVDVDKLQTTIDDLKAQRDDQEQVVKSLSGKKASETVTSPVKGRVKKVFADEGEDVSTVISRDGALALLSTDGLMKVRFIPEASIDLRTGAAVSVKDDRGNEWDGRVASTSGATKEVTVTFTDDGPKLGDTVSVYQGALIGTGRAEINAPLTITATGGTVDRSRYKNKENASVSKGTALFDLTDVPISDAYKSALKRRQDILDQIERSEALLDSGEITAPASGIVEAVYGNVTNVPLGKDTAILSLSSDEKLDMVVSVDELDVVRLAVGQRATVTVNALPGQEFSGTVKKVAFVGKPVGGVTMYDVTIEMDNAAGMRVGMTGSATIEVG
jgi:HlyD family secretion protein